MSAMDPARSQDLIDRLKRIEGQARGIQKMIEEGRECDAVINQVSAMKSATHALSGKLLEGYVTYCLAHPDELGSAEKTISTMVDTVVRASR
jgi:CsoR family transcriptional regulator, copper-sensing transcriptional repressor